MTNRLSKNEVYTRKRRANGSNMHKPNAVSHKTIILLRKTYGNGFIADNI